MQRGKKLFNGSRVWLSAFKDKRIETPELKTLVLNIYKDYNISVAGFLEKLRVKMFSENLHYSLSHSFLLKLAVLFITAALLFNCVFACFARNNLAAAAKVSKDAVSAVMFVSDVINKVSVSFSNSFLNSDDYKNSASNSSSEDENAQKMRADAPPAGISQQFKYKQNMKSFQDITKELHFGYGKNFFDAAKGSFITSQDFGGFEFFCFFMMIICFIVAKRSYENAGAFVKFNNIVL
ncbi:MAG: hypothetical protein LBQ47_04335 [Endomicrobium sp.]|nr:hypothetical protein [Endomicrobium sp.]